MCHNVPHDGMLCHLGAWDMATYSGQHDTMACSKLSKTLGFMHKTVAWGAQVDKSQKTEFAKQKKYEGWCHTLAGCCQLEFWKNDQPRHGPHLGWLLST